MKPKFQKKWVFITAFFAVLLLALPVLVGRFRAPPARVLPVLGKLENASFVDQDGKAFSLADLQGRVWIADFIFTSCRDVCPTLTLRMRALQQALGKAGLADVTLISFTVDPETDTPARLREYAAAHDADIRSWKFLTGDLQTVSETITHGFKVALDRSPSAENPALFEITHGNRFILVDRELAIRGYFDADEKNFAELLRAIRSLRGKSALTAKN